MYGVLIALVLSLCLSAEGLAAGAVDYSKCAEFFNNPPSEEGEANSGYRSDDPARSLRMAFAAFHSASERMDQLKLMMMFFRKKLDLTKME